MLTHRRIAALPASLVLLLAAVSGMAAADDSLPLRHVIEDIAWVPQTWNNCGPATLSMAMDRWGISATQQEIADLIRPNPRDGHVSMDQIAAAAAAKGMVSHYVPSGTLDAVKAFIADGFPVMMPTWHIDETGGQMGHYRLVHGYDAEEGLLFLRDSLEPEGYIMDYETFDVLWRVFNRRMMVVSPPDRSADAESIAAVLGSDAEMLEVSLDLAAREVRPPERLPEGMKSSQYRAYSDYNRAMAFTALGRYSEAADAVLAAFGKGLPWRMLWYQPEVLESMFNAGEYSWIVAETTRALNPYPYLEELWYWRGRAEKAMGRTEEADRAFRRALEIRPGWDLAVHALQGGDGIGEGSDSAG